MIAAVQNILLDLRCKRRGCAEGGARLRTGRQDQLRSRPPADADRQRHVLILLTAQQTYLQSEIQVVQARAARLSTRGRFIRRLAAVGGTASTFARESAQPWHGASRPASDKDGATDFCAAFGSGLTKPIDRLNFALATTLGPMESRAS